MEGTERCVPMHIAMFLVMSNFCILQHPVLIRTTRKRLSERSRFNASLKFVNRTLPSSQTNLKLQNLEAYQLGPEFERPAFDVVNAVTSSPQSEESMRLLLRYDSLRVFSLIFDISSVCDSTLYSIERFAKKRVSQTWLRRLWEHRSDKRKISKYRDILEHQLAVFCVG